MSAQAFLDTIEKRRTYYQISNKSPISDARIQEIIAHAIKHVPSPFNNQTTRIVLLVKGEHEKLWEITKDVIRAHVSAEAWPTSETKLNGFQGGYASILFFDDNETIEASQAAFKVYHDKFPVWATESNAYHQYAIWTALELEGLGANLQHYNPIISTQVTEQWKLPAKWILKAQLVIGTPVAEPFPKTFKPVEDRFKSFGV